MLIPIRKPVLSIQSSSAGADAIVSGKCTLSRIPLNFHCTSCTSALVLHPFCDQRASFKHLFHIRKISIMKCMRSKDEVCTLHRSGHLSDLHIFYPSSLAMVQTGCDVTISFSFGSNCSTLYFLLRQSSLSKILTRGSH